MSFHYHEPTSLAEAAEFGADDVAWTELAPAHLDDEIGPAGKSLHRVPGLDGIGVDGALTLGALATHRSLERRPAFQDRLRALVEG